MTLPPIMCAVCRREVDQTHVTDDPASGKFRIRVICHDDTQVETVDLRTFAPPWKIVAAIAFAGASAPFTKETFR